MRKIKFLDFSANRVFTKMSKKKSLAQVGLNPNCVQVWTFQGMLPTQTTAFFQSSHGIRRVQRHRRDPRRIDLADSAVAALEEKMPHPRTRRPGKAVPL